MKTIYIFYWHLHKFPDLPYEHNEEFGYTTETRENIVSTILSKGYSVMLRPQQSNLMIAIDNGRFGQR